MMAITTAGQKEASTLAGSPSQIGTGYAWNLTKPDIHSRLAGGVCTAHHARHKGYSDFVQHTDPMVSGQSRSSSSGAQTLRVTFGYSETAHNSYRVEQSLCADFIGMQIGRNPLMGLNSDEFPKLNNSLVSLLILTLGKLLILSQSTNGGGWLNSLIIPQTCRAGSRETEHYRYSGSAVIQNGCNKENQQVTGKEKGNAANAALWMNSFLNHEGNQHSPDLSDGRKPNLAYEQNQYLAAQQDNRPSLRGVVQPFGLMPRTINSRRASSFIQFAKLTPSRSASVSNCVLSSGLIRMWNGGDFPAPLGWLSLTVTSFSIDMCTPIDLSLFSLGVHTNMCVPKKTTPPKGITSTRRGLTTNVNASNEVAMLDHTQTRPEFTFLFLAVRRSDVTDRPHRHQVTAPTYDAARRLVARDYVAAFAGRLPIKEVRHV